MPILGTGLAINHKEVVHAEVGLLFGATMTVGDAVGSKPLQPERQCNCEESLNAERLQVPLDKTVDKQPTKKATALQLCRTVCG